MKKSFVIVGLVGVCALFASPVVAQNLLLNGNLELAGGGPPGWTLQEFPSTGAGTFDTAEQIGFADRDGVEGEKGLWLKPFAGGSTAPSRLTNAVLSQTVPAVAGERYSFSGWSRWELNYAGGVATLDPASPFGAIPSPTRTEMELAFLNSGGAVIGSPFVLDLRTQQNNFDFWVQHDFNTTFGGGNPLLAPAGTTNIRVRARMVDAAFNVDPQQSAFFDDFSLTAATNPANELLVNALLDTSPSEFPFFDVTEGPMGVDTVNAQSAVWAQNSNTAGNVGAFLHPWANGGLVADANDAILSQTVNGIAGGTYTFKVWTKFEGNFSGGVDTLSTNSPNGNIPSPTDMPMKIEFLNASNVVIGTPAMLDMRTDREAQGGGNANDSAWREHTLTAVSPAGTTKVRVSAAMIDGVFNTDPQQSAFLDDFSLTLASTAIDGDFNNDGLYNCADIDALTNAVAMSGSVAQFDLNGDGMLSLADVDRWRADAGAINIGTGRVYKVGDANLDGNVDGTDFGLWNSAKFTANKNWCNGNFNADAVTDGSDFGLWNSNKFTSADGSLVPEPSVGLCGLLLLGLGRRSARR